MISAIGTFFLGILLGLAEHASYMSSVHNSAQGKTFQSVACFLCFFVSTMWGISFLVDENWVGMIGAATGGSIGVAIVSRKNKKS